MSTLKKLVYIIPTYNEKENILSMLEVVSALLSKLKKYNSNILIVDDNSPDGTGNIVRLYKKKDKAVKIITGKKNGLGSAMIRGIKYSIKDLKADIIISNEADFSYNPRLIIPMLKMIENGIDVVIVKRKISKNKKWSVTRNLIHWIANNFFARIIAGVTEVYDHDSAFRAIKVKNVLDKIKFNNFPKGFAFFNYFIFRISQVTTKIGEIDGVYTPRKKGESKVSLKPKYFKYFLKDSFEYVFNSFRIRIEKTFK